MMPMMAVIHLNLPARQLPSGGKGNRREGGGGNCSSGTLQSCFWNKWDVWDSWRFLGDDCRWAPSKRFLELIL